MIPRSNGSTMHSSNPSPATRRPARFQISLFDDACCESPYPDPFSPAQGEILNLDFNNMTASVQKSYPHDPSLFPNSQGDVEALSNGDEFIGWGAEPYYSEYTQNGTVLYDVLMPGDDISYRAYRNTWVGLPLTRPSAAVRLVNGSPVVYASWNGSTETVAWRLLAGPNPNALSPVSTTSRTGFETALATPTISRFYQVQALDAQGRVLGTSHILSNCHMGSHGLIDELRRVTNRLNGRKIPIISEFRRSQKGIIRRSVSPTAPPCTRFRESREAEENLQCRGSRDRWLYHDASLGDVPCGRVCVVSHVRRCCWMPVHR